MNFSKRSQKFKENALLTTIFIIYWGILYTHTMNAIYMHINKKRPEFGNFNCYRDA